MSLADTIRGWFKTDISALEARILELEKDQQLLSDTIRTLSQTQYDQAKRLVDHGMTIGRLNTQLTALSEGVIVLSERVLVLEELEQKRDELFLPGSGGTGAGA